MQPLTQHRNRTVIVDQVRVADNALAKSFLTATVAAGVSALTVKDIAGFAVGKFVWINPYAPNSEIIAVHAATAPSGSTLTLATTTAFPHAIGEQVVYVEFNQIEIHHAATLAGAKTLLATQGMIAREKELVYLDVTQTTGFYFARFKNSVATLYSAYSDGVPYGGWGVNTVGYMTDRALRDSKNKFGENVTLADCLAWVNDGLQEIKGKLRNWPEHFVYNYVAGTTARGVNTVTLPVNIYSNETNASIEALRVGSDRQLHYLDPGSFDAQMGGVRSNSVRTEAAVGATSLLITNSNDFDETGSVSVYLAGVKYTMTYTGVTRSETVGVLTGIPASGDGSITVIIPVGTVVWQQEDEGQPNFYTVRNGVIEFWPLPSSQYDNQSVYLDYNTAASVVDSESDTIDFQRFDMLKAYLTWRIWCKSDNNGKLDLNNGYYVQYKERLNDAIRTMPVKKSSVGPNLNYMRRRGGFGSKPDPKLLSNDQQ